MKKYVVLHKKVGETPLTALMAWKATHSEYEGVPAAYAGRLDPMAEGKLLVLLGEECKRQGKYHGLDKEYEIEVLLDAGSDTGDALGLVTYGGKETRVDPKQLKSVLAAELGAHMRAYPAFSSKTVNGKPLFLHALEGSLTSIEVPEHLEKIYRIRTLRFDRIGSDALKERIATFLSKVPTTDEPSKALGADFRIQDVRTSWQGFFSQAGVRQFTVISLRVTCGSGTYMRTLAPRIGEALGTTALALSIRRTRIGKRWFGLWVKDF